MTGEEITRSRVGIRGPSSLIGQALALHVGMDPRFEAVYIGTAGTAGQEFDLIVHDATVDAPGSSLDPVPHGVPLVVVGGARPGPESSARAWLPATSDPAVLVDLLVDVVAGADTPVTPLHRADRDAVASLSPREREVGGLLADNLTDREISERLRVSMPTVRSHVRRIAHKVGVAGRRDVKAAVVSLGLGAERRRTALYEGPGIRSRPVIRAHVLLRPGFVREAVVAALGGQRWLVTTTGGGSGDVSHGDLAVLESGPEGIELCRHLRASIPDAKLLMVGHQLVPEELSASIRAGADGYISASSSPETLISAAQRVAMGDASIPQGMLRRLLRDLADIKHQEEQAIIRFCGLTEREKGYVALISEGHSYDDIASQLVVSPHTVRTHVQNIMRKLGVSSRQDVANLVHTFDLVARFADRGDPRPFLP